MPTSTLKASAFAFFILFIASCASRDVSDSSKVDQSQIARTYTLNWKEDEPIIHATAVFRFGGFTGTTLCLDSVSSIELNGELMDYGVGILSGAFYRGDIPADDQVEARFHYTDINLNTYFDKILCNKVDILLPDTIHLGDVIELNPTGRIETGDELSISFKDAQGTSTSIPIVPPSEGATTLSGGYLKTLSSGLGSFHLTLNRFYQKTNDDGTQCKLSYEFKTTERRLVLDLDGETHIDKSL